MGGPRSAGRAGGAGRRGAGRGTWMSAVFDGSVSALTATPPRGTFLGRSSSTTAMHTDRWSVTAWFLCCFK